MAVRVRGKPATLNRAILVWGATRPDGKQAARTEYAFPDVLSVEDILADLRRWRAAHWDARVQNFVPGPTSCLMGEIEGVAVTFANRQQIGAPRPS